MFKEFYKIVLDEIQFPFINDNIINALAEDNVYNDEKFLFFDDVEPSLKELGKNYMLGVVSDTWPSLEMVFINKGLKKYFSTFNNGQKKDVIIVLGYPAKKDGSVSPILRERINKAAKLYHEGIAEVIICTGAAVANNYVEADVIAQTLIELGVPNCSIIREKLARGTYENLVNSKKIMKDRGLRTAVIVSSPWHLRKASSYAFRLEINHTVEKSKFPHEYLIIGVVIIYLYLYTQMFIKLCGIMKPGNRAKS